MEITKHAMNQKSTQQKGKNWHPKKKKENWNHLQFWFVDGFISLHFNVSLQSLDVKG